VQGHGGRGADQEAEPAVKIPHRVLMALTDDCRLHARVNLGAEKWWNIHITDWEMPS
jgi:hypothetical protein